MALRIGIYAIEKNEAANVARWEESSREADVRVVTDTGSGDGTPELLAARGVKVREAFVVPWRWDDAHNAGMQGLPPDVDVAIRLDLDEALAPGWREVVERNWTEGTTRLRCRYEWGPGEVIVGDRIHARSGFRWRSPTHEWLHAWDGSPQVERDIEDVLIVQRRTPGKVHTSDLELLRIGTKEEPNDARMAWYLARQLSFTNDPSEAETLDKYLAMPGGSSHERAAALRRLAELRKDDARRYLTLAALEAPAEPEAYLGLAADCQARGNYAGALYWSLFAVQAPPGAENHASDHIAYGPTPAEIGANAALILGRASEALYCIRQGLAKKPDNPALLDLLSDLSDQTKGPRT
jgi:hypothetical protein